MKSLLSNMHLLLRVPAFARWPLEIRFFAEDVHQAWLGWIAQSEDKLRATLPTVLDRPQLPPTQPEEMVPQSASPSKRKVAAVTGHGIERLIIDYSSVKDHVEKGKAVFDFEREGKCAVCKEDLEHEGGIYTICPNHSCEAVSHLTCLSQHFLDLESSGLEQTQSLVPIQGTCPCCVTEIRWVDVVKELTLRMRGQKEVEKLLKVPRARKTKATKIGTKKKATAILAEAEDDSDSQGSEDGNIVEAVMPLEVPEFPTNWQTLDSNASQSSSNATPESITKSKRISRPDKLPLVIEDSDWENAEVTE
jgi:structure-specific endonuclease subunit SLX1